MKRVQLYVITLLIVTSMPLIADRDFYIDTTVPSDNIPAGEYWHVHYPAVLTLDVDETLDVYGTLYIDAGAYFVVDLDAVINVRNGGNVYLLNQNLNGIANFTMNAGSHMYLENNALVTINDGGHLHLTQNSYITLNGQYSILRFFDDTGTLTIDQGAYIEMNSGCQIANLSGAGGVIECYESWPFRGIGYMHRIIINFYNDLNIDPLDNLVFKYGADFTFDCSTTYNINVDGYLEFRGEFDMPEYRFSGCINNIELADGATFKVDGKLNGSLSMLTTPNIIGNIGSTLEFFGEDTANTIVNFGSGKGISTFGSLHAEYTAFEGFSTPSWTGIELIWCKFLTKY